MSELSKEGENTLDENTVKLWLEEMRKPGLTGFSLRTELGKALDGHDAVAEDFLRKAAKLQPDYIRESPFSEHAKRLEREEMLRSHSEE